MIFSRLSTEIELNPIVCKRRNKFAKMAIIVAFPRKSLENNALFAKETQNVEDKRYLQGRLLKWK